jgi:hypothetical protein
MYHNTGGPLTPVMGSFGAPSMLVHLLIAAKEKWIENSDVLLYNFHFFLLASLARVFYSHTKTDRNLIGYDLGLLFW